MIGHADATAADQCLLELISCHTPYIIIKMWLL